MSKKMCKLAQKDVPSEDRKKYLECALPAKYLCKECGRTARKKDYLCKPKKVREQD